MKISEKTFIRIPICLTLMALFTAAFAVENTTDSSVIEKMPVYLNVIDSSGKFEAKIIKNNKCENNIKDNDISGLRFLGCADNTTKFALFYDKSNIARKGSSAEDGFTFPLKGQEVPEMSMNRFCGKTITDNYNIFMSIKKGPIGISSWLITLTIENVKP